MSVKSKKYKLKRPAKILLFVFGLLVVIITGIQIWFVNNASDIIKSIVDKKSNGKIKLELKHASFSFFRNQMQIKEGKLSSTDAAEAPSSYNVKFSKLTLRVRSLWPLLFNRDLRLDSINIQSPQIEVVQLRSDTSAVNKKDVSVAEEMGRVYNSMLSVLKSFGIRRILVNNGSLKLVNKISPGTLPVTITNINLNVLRKPEDGDWQTSVEEMVNLTSANQNIDLPDGRHRLSFRNFNLQLFRNRIDLDSCTITAVPKNDQPNSYTIFFKHLSLVGVDFAALSKQNLIKADSVYCQNPMFNFNIVSNEKHNNNNTAPDVKKIITDLTSDLDLHYVGVMNAGIHFNIVGSRPRYISNSNKDNFEVSGLKVKADSASPVSVKRFDMLVRDYHLYNVDSSAIFSFDSIHFINNKILLNNFTIVTTPSKLKLKSLRDFRFPYFELSGLDWYQLIFNQNVVAKQAVLKNPVLKYTRRTPGTAKGTGFFSRLQSLDSLMTLERLNIENGNLFLNFGKSASLDLYNVNLKVSSNELLAAKSQVGIQKAVDYFSMAKGILKRNDLTGQLINVTYKPENLMYADQLLLNSSTGNINAAISDVFINNMFLDDATETIYADGVEWKEAVVQLRTKTEKNIAKKNLEGSFDIKNISGNNTRLVLDNGITSINSSAGGLMIDSLTKINNGAATASGLHFTNNKLDLENDKKKIHGSVEKIDAALVAIRDEGKDISAKGIRWSNAEINITDLVKKEERKSNGSSLSLTNVQGVQTVVNVQNSSGSLTTIVDQVRAKRIEKKSDAAMFTDGLFIAGHTLAMKGPGLSANVANYQLSEKGLSNLSDLQLEHNNNGSTVKIDAPAISFQININSLLSNQYHFSSLKVTAPGIVINTHPHSDTLANTARIRSDLSIDTLTIVEPALQLIAGENDSAATLTIERTKESLITASHFSMGDSGIHMKSLKVDSKTLNFAASANAAVEGKFSLDLRDIAVNKHEGKISWQTTLQTADLVNPDNLVRLRNNNLVLKEFLAGDFFLSSGNVKDIRQILSDNPGARVQSSTGIYLDSNNTYKWYGAGYDHQKRLLHLDSFSYHPVLQRDSFIARSPVETDYITFTTGAINATAFNLDSFNVNKAILADTINVSNPVINIYRDKLAPSGPKEIKYLPTRMISEVKVPLNVGSVMVNDGQVAYTEKNDETRKEGTLLLANVNGEISNIHNGNYATTDSLGIWLNSKLMGEAPLRLKIKEAYKDSLKTFVMQLHLDPFEMKILNPVLVPLTDVLVTSGRVDTIDLTATASNQFAAGNIKMLYNNLHIKLVSDGDPRKSTFKNKILTFLANTFIVKNGNDADRSTIFWKRIHEKSFFNYLLKIAFNGMGSSVGVVKDRKNKRNFKNELEDRNLPDDYLDSMLKH